MKIKEVTFHKHGGWGFKVDTDLDIKRLDRIKAGDKFFTIDMLTEWLYDGVRNEICLTLSPNEKAHDTIKAGDEVELIKKDEFEKNVNFDGLLSNCLLKCKSGMSLSDVFDSLCEYNGFTFVKLMDKWNMNYNDGKFLSEIWFDHVGDFNEGFARVYLDGKGWNLIHNNGNLLSDVWFDDIDDYFNNGFAKVELNGTKYKISRTGELCQIDIE